MPAPTTSPSTGAPRRWFTRRHGYGPLLLAYALLMTASRVAARLILFPSTDPLPTPGATRVQVPTPGGSHVEVFTARSYPARAAEPQAYLLVFIGNADR